MSTQNYRAVVCEELGLPDRLRLRELPRRPLGAGEMRVALKAAGVNFPDVLMIQGLYQHRPELPFVPGLEATVTWRKLDFYVEAEYVRDNHERTGSYFYAWSELGFRPVEWLRAGIAGQRTKVYGGERDIQRGPFVQVTWGPVTFGGYWFNPGSSAQVFVGMIGAAF